MQTLPACPGLKPYSPRRRGTKAGLCAETAVLKATNGALCQPRIAPGEEGPRVPQQSRSEQSRISSSAGHANVIKRRCRAGPPILPWMIPPAATGAQKQKGSFEGKDFLANSCPQREAAGLWEQGTLTTPKSHVCSHLGSCPWLCQPPRPLQC